MHGPHVEPAVNRQPGFRRGAVEQSAFNNTHTSKNNLYVLFFRTAERDGQTGGTNAGMKGGAHGQTNRQTNKRLTDERTKERTNEHDNER